MKYAFKLFINGESVASQKAVTNLRKIVRKNLSVGYDIQVVDVIKEPALAAEAGIIATPTVIKKVPPPERKVIGDLSDKEKVLLGLGLKVSKNAADNFEEKETLDE